MNINDSYMKQAINLAEQGRYTVSPNPPVGCVIVKDHEVIAVGYHQKAGGPHAEVVALKVAGEEAQGADVYVTLEPCCHHGQTGPCAEALIEAGVQRVFVGCVDPNPLIAGEGINSLRAAGITVEVGILQEACEALIRIFSHYIQHKQPYVIAKWAMSLDGKTITHEEDSPQISGEETFQFTQALRAEVDAIVVGANTAKGDDPELTVRSAEFKQSRPPIRIIIGSRETVMPTDLRVFQTAKQIPTWLVLPKGVQAERLSSMGVVIIHADTLPELLDKLARNAITSILLEGGMSLLSSFMQEGLIHECHSIVAPCLIGSLKQKQLIPLTSIQQLGKDTVFSSSHIHLTKEVE